MKKVIALDIGGTNTRVALIDEKYNILSEIINPTLRGKTDVFLENVAKTIDECVKDFTDVVALAMGVPGRVRYDGFIAALPNIHIKNIPLADYLSNRYHLPAYVINDAEVAALAEANLGKYKDSKSLYFVTISTGVGGAFTRNGKIVNSSYEVGHTMFDYKGETHEFEHMASGTGIIKLASMNGLEIKNAREFFGMVRENNPIAMPIYHDWIHLLASWLEMNQFNFEPEIFTLTGGVMKSADLFFKDLKEACPHCKLELCSYGQEAGLMGAAVLGFQKESN